MKKNILLKKLINSSKLEFLMEAHNGLSAKIVEEAGFKGIWASGLAISAAFGVRDNNEVSWTQILDVLEFMSEATKIPILLDGDTGYGNFNNVRRLVRKLEQRNVGGVCIEDKLFPKSNSFISGETQPLADIDEFSGKIKAAKDTQNDSDFIVVARVEAFITGWGLGEALRRAEAYRKAGADAILVHSKRSDANDIESFMREWNNRHPVIVIPTKYYSMPTDKFRNLGISMVIWANHNIRASIDIMQKTSRQIFNDQSLVNVEDKIVSVSEVFRLQGADELREAEKKYFPASGKKVNAIILAASQGDLGELTKEVPKTLIYVNGMSILANQVFNLNKVGIKDITVVRGFAKGKVVMSNIKTIDNDEYQKTKDLYSLFLAADKIDKNTIISFGDIVFKSHVLNELLNDNNDITLVVDPDYEIERGDVKDYVKAEEPYSKKLFSRAVRFEKMSTNLAEDKIDGEFIGLWKVNDVGAKIVKFALNKLSESENFTNMSMADLFNEIAKSHIIVVKYIKGSWWDIDTVIDLQKAESL